MVEVIEGTVTHDNVSYVVSEVITNLSEVDEQRLIGLKVCRRVQAELQVDEAAAIEAEEAESKTEDDKLTEGGMVLSDEIVTAVDLSINPNDLITAAPPKGSKKKD